MERPIFNVRAYGLYVKDDSILVTDEFRMGMRMTKFPGGGLEFGEGLLDCIRRECVEEFGQEFHVLSHFYTTDFFQASAFNSKQQLISVYYLVEPVGELKCPVTKVAFSFEHEAEGAQCFRFIPFDKLNENDLTFPVDRHVARLLLETFAPGK